MGRVYGLWPVFILATGLAIGLSSCAARTVVPVQMAQPGDDAMRCEAIADEMAANNATAEKLVRADEKVREGNVAKTVGSAIPYVGILLAMSSDLSNEEQVKARALADRNERLGYLQKQKGCKS